MHLCKLEGACLCMLPKLMMHNLYMATSRCTSAPRLYFHHQLNVEPCGDHLPLFPCYLKDMNKVCYFTFPPSPTQMVLTAKNIVIATGGRPKYPANVNIIIIPPPRFESLIFQSSKHFPSSEARVCFESFKLWHIYCTRFHERQQVFQTMNRFIFW